jgi:hypothetical protein
MHACRAYTVDLEKYVVELAAGAGGKVRRAFDVQKGVAPLVLDMNL